MSVRRLLVQGAPLRALFMLFHWLPVAVVAAEPPPHSPAPVAPPAATDGNQVRSGERFATFFAPFQSDIAALSPDGKLLAYSLREGDLLSVVVLEIDNPGTAKAKVTVLSDKQATPALSRTSAERTPARINWMRWITPTRLAVETNRIFATIEGTTSASEWTSVPGEILAFDADGANARTLADARRVSRQKTSTLSGTPELVETDDFTVAGSASPESAGQGGAPSTTNSRYRPPRVLGLDPAHEDSLLVLGHANDGYGLYSIHTVTGKMRYLEEEIFDPRMVMLLDRAGKPRIGVEYRTNKRFPLPFLVETGRFGRPWHKLDVIASKAGLGEGFAIAPATYFGRRHVPLGFGPDADTLFFASNVGKETFGIYSINLSSNRLTGTAIENPALDLWEPSPGTFPDLSASWFSQGLDTDALADALNDAYQDDLASEGLANESTENDRPITVTTSGDRSALVSTSILPARNTDDGLLVFDRHTHQLAGIRIRGTRPTTQWLSRELAETQAILEQRFRPNTVEIREWDSAVNRFLLTVSGPALPGAWYVFDRTARNASEFVPRAPWLAGVTSPTMLAFAFNSPQDVPIQGMITVPRAPRVRPIPAVFVTPRQPWQSWTPAYKVEIQALADMGFAVVEYSGRGAWGRGVGLRSRIQEGFEDAQVEDLIATVDYVTNHFAVAPRRLAVLGIDHGGHVALRALERAPERFRGAIAIGAPVNLRAWLGELEWQGGSAQSLLMEPMFGDRERQTAAPLIRDVALIQRPALLFNYRGPSGASSTHNYTAARQFAAALARRVPATEIVDLSDDYMNGLPKARGAVFARIEEFLNANIYDYGVKAGELEVDETE